MKGNFEKHLLGIFKALKNRFDYINQSVGHSLTIGEENESEIRKLLLDFLPKRYGIGSGIIIDTKGNQSKQVDIVIYDRESPNYTLSSDSKLFLVDQVIATIEIKTTFTTGESGSLKQAIDNSASIKKLIPSQKQWVEDTITIKPDGHTAFELITYNPKPPITIVFFYSIQNRKTAIDLDSFFNSVKSELSNYPFQEQPNLLLSLDHGGLFMHNDLAQIKEGKFSVCLLNVNGNYKRQLSIVQVDDKYKAIVNFGDSMFEEDNSVNVKFLTNTDSSINVVAIEGDDLVLDPLVYRTGKIKGQVYFIDSYRAFLSFVYTIEFSLRLKKSNKNMFITDYFPKDYFEISDYNDGLNMTD